MQIGFHPLRPGEIPNADAIVIEDSLCALPRESPYNAARRFERCNEMVFELYQDCLPAFGADRGRVGRIYEARCTVGKRNQDGWKPRLARRQRVRVRPDSPNDDALVFEDLRRIFLSER